MDSLYTKEIAQFVFSLRWPESLKFIVVEKTFPEPYLQFVFYRDNFETFTGEGKLYITNLIQQMMMTLRKDGVPCYLEVKEEVPHV